MGLFSKSLTRAELIAAFGDETTALAMYDTDTQAVRNAPGAECLTVENGKITHMRIIFDRLPFDAGATSVSNNLKLQRVLRRAGGDRRDQDSPPAASGCA